VDERTRKSERRMNEGVAAPIGAEPPNPAKTFEKIVSLTQVPPYREDGREI